MADKMKKQFFRFTELANQSLFRGEKTEVLTESLLSAERRIDALQKACSVSARKILSCLAGHGTDPLTVEKRSKKIPEIVLGDSMLASSTPFGETSVLGRILHDVGDLESKLGYELLQYELKVEQIVVARLQQVENEVASVMKNRRNLNKLTLEMDASKKVYQSNRVSVGNNKSDQLREEMEDAYQKVELSRDALATEIYTLIAREPEFAEMILQYAQLKRDYHKAALQLLEINIPKFELIIGENPCRPVFGTKLEVHLESSGRTIAYPIELCVCALLELGLEEEGLFRVAGGSSKVRKLKAAFDAGYAELGAVVEDCRDPHAITSVLKSYLRELPEPVLAHELYDDWIAAVRVGDLEGRLQAMKQVLGKMSESRFANLRYLVRFLAEIVKYQESNKMTPSNLAIVTAPNFIWSPSEDKSVLGLNMSLASTYSLIIENLIFHCDFFFPSSGDMDFYVTCSKLIAEQPSPKVQKTNTRISAPECAQEATAPISRGHRRIGSFDGILSFANGGDTGPSGSPKMPLRRKNKPAPVPPTPPKTDEPPPTPGPEQRTPQEVEKARPPLPPPPSERTATLPRLKEQKAKSAKAEIEKQKSKEDLLAEIEKEMNRKQEEELQKAQAEEATREAEDNEECPRRESNTLIRAASIRNRAALFERPIEDSRMSKSVGSLAGDGSDSSVVHKRLTFLEAQQIAPIRVPVPAERKLPGPVPSSPGPAVSEVRKSLEKYATTVEVEKSKPIIPERPVALPRVERKNSVNSELGKAVLEKTHVYSVDKQQASLVQVQSHDTTLPRKGSSSNFHLDCIRQDKGGSSPVYEKRQSIEDKPTDRSSIQGASERSSIQDSQNVKRHSVSDISINGKTNFEKTIQAFEFADSDAKDEKIEKVESVAKKGEKSGESSDSDVEVRKKPVKPPKPERPAIKTTSGSRSSNEGMDVTPVEPAEKEGRSEPVASSDTKTPVPLPRPVSQPIAKPRSGSGESTDF